MRIFGCLLLVAGYQVFIFMSVLLILETNISKEGGSICFDTIDY